MEQSKKQNKPVKQSNRNKQAENSQTKRNLKEKGFKQAKQYPDLFTNENGIVYSLKAGRELKTTRRNTIILKTGKHVSVPKLVLSAFRNEPIRENTHIKYLDGNRSNLSVLNVEYIRKYESGLKCKLNIENLHTAIRCYFEVPKRDKVKDCIQTRFYLTGIIEKRSFYVYNCNRYGLDVFFSYMQGISNNFKDVGKQHNINIKDVPIIVNGFINLLTSDILADLEAGTLQIKDFLPRPKTKTQAIREWNEYRKELGCEPLPLRKKSTKEKLNDFKKKLNEAINEQKQ